MLTVCILLMCVASKSCDSGCLRFSDAYKGYLISNIHSSILTSLAALYYHRSIANVKQFHSIHLLSNLIYSEWVWLYQVADCNSSRFDVIPCWKGENLSDWGMEWGMPSLPDSAMSVLVPIKLPSTAHVPFGITKMSCKDIREKIAKSTISWNHIEKNHSCFLAENLDIFLFGCVAIFLEKKTSPNSIDRHILVLLFTGFYYDLCRFCTSKTHWFGIWFMFRFK